MNKKNILIADDSNIVLNFLEKNIKDYNILKAEDGIKTLSLINNTEIYALILDLNMPTIDGFKVLNSLENNNLIDKFPVIIITGDDTEKTIKKALDYPVLKILNKPFNKKDINTMLKYIKNFYENKEDI